MISTVYRGAVRPALLRVGAKPAHPAMLLALVAALSLAPLAQAQQASAPASAQAAASSAASPAAPAATPAPAPAAKAAPQLGFPGPAAQTAPAAGSLLQTIASLLFVLALLGGLAWFVKRFGPRAAGGSAHLRVVSALSLGGRERVMVVEVAGQWIVVGASPGRVNLLATMPRQEGAEPAAPMAAGLPSGFAEWLKQTIDKRNAK
jgi:flagellar protein FliO/FliZ